MTRLPPDNTFLATRDWVKLSLSYRKAHPLCELCASDGRTVGAREVDHIVPRDRGGALYDEENLQALCRDCHFHKTRVDKGVTKPTVKIDGTVVMEKLEYHHAQRPGKKG